MRIGPTAFESHNVKYANVLKAKEAGQHCTHPNPQRKNQKELKVSSRFSLFPLFSSSAAQLTLKITAPKSNVTSWPTIHPSLLPHFPLPHPHTNMTMICKK